MVIALRETYVSSSPQWLRCYMCSNEQFKSLSTRSQYTIHLVTFQCYPLRCVVCAGLSPPDAAAPPGASSTQGERNMIQLMQTHPSGPPDASSARVNARTPETQPDESPSHALPCSPRPATLPRILHAPWSATTPRPAGRLDSTQAPTSDRGPPDHDHPPQPRTARRQPKTRARADPGLSSTPPPATCGVSIGRIPPGQPQKLWLATPGASSANS